MDFCNLWFQFGWWKFMSDRYTMKVAIEEHKDVDSGEANRIQGLQEPFIQHEKDAAACKDVESNTTVENGSIGMVLLLFVVLSHLELVGYSAPTQAAIREDLNLSLAEFSMFGSLVTIGATLGAITSGRITDFIGRKGDPYSLDLGRFFTGYGIGVISFVVPVYIAEIAPKNLRGGLATTNQLMIVIGSSISFLLGSFLSWRQLALAGLVPCISLLIGLHFIPESPRWLDYIETLQSLPKTKFLALFQSKHVRSVVIGVGLMVCQQSVGINGIGFYTAETFVREELNERLKTWRRALEIHGFRLSRSKSEYMECKFNKRRRVSNSEVKIGDHIISQVTRFKYLGSVIQDDGEIEGDVNHRIQAGWMKWRKASGVLCDAKVPIKLKGKFYRTAVRPAILYGTECWAVKSQHENKVGVAEMRMLRWMCGLSSGKIGSIAYACMQVPFTVLGAMLMDKSGRRPLIMDQSLLLDCVPILAVASVLIYVGAFSIGMGPVPWVIMSEENSSNVLILVFTLQIFLIHVKGTAGSLVVLVNWLGAWVVSYTFNFLMSWSSLAKLLPETKGKTLEEVQACINS
ncbi:Sugar transporter ERD6-like 16 [Glycine soja]|uniref:Sugar transporter ERD6-like 16 n=1 Tax=Glycine soja TaxID=3848 RepID=A0A445K1J1_GLYSO|nr:Sugar transporter ERD6-like 16 [Glycine soja]